MPRGAVDSSTHYCPGPQGIGQKYIDLSTVMMGIVLTILPNSHEITSAEPETNHILLVIDCMIGA